MTEEQKQAHLQEMRLYESEQQISQIMQPLKHRGRSIWTLCTEDHKQEAFRRLNDVLSGKVVPFDEAVDYLKDIRAGRA